MTAYSSFSDPSDRHAPPHFHTYRFDKNFKEDWRHVGRTIYTYQDHFEDTWLEINASWRMDDDGGPPYETPFRRPKVGDTMFEIDKDGYHNTSRVDKVGSGFVSISGWRRGAEFSMNLSINEWRVIYDKYLRSED